MLVEFRIIGYADVHCNLPFEVIGQWRMHLHPFFAILL